MKLLILVAFLAVPFLVVALLKTLARCGGDDQIDALIAANKAKSRKGMELIDWEKANEAGGRAWNEALRGQRRYGQKKAETETRVH